MARLPQPGGDSGNWGSILNEYLSQAHDSDGKLKNSSVGPEQIQANAITKSQLSSSLANELDRKLAVTEAQNTYATSEDVSSLNTYILPVLGQSNAVGAALDRNTAIDTLDARVFQYARTGPSAGTIIPATEPLYHPYSSADFGFHVPLAKELLAQLPYGSKIIIVPCARSGSTIMPGNGSYDQFCWRTTFTPPVGGANLTLSSVNAINDAIAKSHGKVIAFAWLQGESDGVIGTSQTVYATELDLIIDYLRSHVTSAQHVPFIVSGMVPEGISAVSGRGVINLAHIDTPRRKELTAFAPGPSNAYRIYNGNPDTTHYNALGIRKVAHKLASIYQDAIANIKGIIPDRPSNIVIDDNGITWTAPAGRVTSYQLNVTVGTMLASYTSTSTHLTLSISDTDTVYASVRAVSEAGEGEYAYTERVRTTPTISDPLASITFARALSLRRVVKAYAGPLAEVRRSSDNQVLDINSVAEAQGFAGSGDAYVSKWYDQSGSGSDLVQSVAEKQPKIIAGGTLLTTGGKPCVQFDGTDDYLIGSSTGAYNANAATIAAVVQVDTPSNPEPLGGEYSSLSVNQLYEPMSYATGNTLSAFIRNDSAATILANVTTQEGPQAWSATSPKGLLVIDTGSVWKRRVQKTSLSDIPYTRSGTSTFNQFILGARVRTTPNTFWRGRVGEYLMVYNAVSDSDRTLIENSQASYFSL